MRALAQCSLVRITVNKFNKHNDLFGTVIVVEVCINCLYIHSHDKCIKRCDAFKKRNSLFWLLFSYLLFGFSFILFSINIWSCHFSFRWMRRDEKKSNLLWYLNLNTNFLWTEWSVWYDRSKMAHPMILLFEQRNCLLIK